MWDICEYITTAVCIIYPKIQGLQRVVARVVQH